MSILATSREALGVAGEQVWTVPSLGTDGGSASPAVRLFVDRARAVLPSYELGPDEDLVAEVGRRLDGIPLAIELAAARVRSLSVAQIRDRLDDRFRLLTGGSRRAMQRQKTLRYTVQWSYDLLTEEERTVLCRASVFAGGFTLASAEAVCAGDEVAAGDVLDILDSLVAKSLVSVDRTDLGVRYGLLETIREFAEEQLIQSGGAEAARDHHANHFAAEAVHNRSRASSPKEKEALQWVDAEYANLRAAFRRSVDQGDRPQAVLVVVGTSACDISLLRFESVEWALELVEPAARARVRALSSLYVSASRCAHFGRVREAVAYAEAAVSLVGDPDFDPDPFAREHIALAVSYLYDGRPEGWIEASAAGAERAEDQEVPNNRCDLLWGLAAYGRAEEARLMADDVVAAARATGIPWIIALSLHGYGRAFAETDPQRALLAKREALSIVQASGNLWGQMVVGAELAALEAQHGEARLALEFFDQVISWLDQAGDLANRAGVLGWVVVLLDRMGRHEAAATLYGTDRERLDAVTWVGLAPALDHLRDALGDDRFEELARRGAAMLPPQAISYAHQVLRDALEEVSAGRPA